MRRDVEKVLKEYGQRVVLRRSAEEQEVCAFLQPVVKQAETVPEEMCALGGLDRRLWVYLGQEEVCPGEQILWGQQCFRVRSSRAFQVGEDVLYLWASLEQEREVAE